MFRTLLFSIVLTLVIGSDVPRLCRALCDRATAVANGCHDQAGPSDAPVRLAGRDDCSANDLMDTSYLKEDVQRSAPAPQTSSALAIARDHTVRPAIFAWPDQGAGHWQSLEKRPLETALRI